MSINYDKRWFRVERASGNGDVGDETLFHYRQVGKVVWATYKGGAVQFGTLLASVDAHGHLDMRYQHLDIDDTPRAGICKTRPERLASGRLVLHESWQWTTGDCSRGASILHEVDSPDTLDTLDTLDS